jgi:hypothetical protein
MTYDFDKAVPIPTAVERVGVNIELLKAMEPGDSQWWSEDEAKKAARFYRVAKKLGIPILIRKVGDKDPRGPGVRMWRQEGGEIVVADPIAAAAQKAAAAVKAPRQLPKGVPAKKNASAVDSGLLPAKHKAAPKAKAVAKAPRKPRPSEVKKKKLVAGVPSTPAALKRAGT